MKSRIVVLFVGILVLWSALAMRAAYLQFMPNDRLNSLQSRQFQTKVTLPARRGAIVDRAGRDLAMSMAAYSLYADPKLIENKKKVARQLAKILGMSPATVQSKIKGNRRFVWIKRMLDQETADKIKDLDIRGLAFVEEWKRVYPNENLLSQTLGFLGSEGQGLEGLELGQNPVLAGNKKKVSVKKDARGRPLIQDGLMFIENPEGSELKLTVDSDLQYRLESELAHAITTFEAESAVGIILDAKTSAILGLASAPTFDANKASSAAADVRRNRVITDTFEQGSTMKAFLIATGLREGVIKPNSKFYCEKGSFKVDDRIIREAHMNEKFENLTVAEILARSSNVGTTKIAFEMSQETVRQGFLDFGFGQKLGIDIPGEAKGMIHPTPWKKHLYANISFGHGMTATPLQVANAYAAIANGGVLNTPYIVSSVRDGETGKVREFEPKPIRRVLTQEQAAQMRAMLVGVTTGVGTGKSAAVDGYMVGGKTGTAQKVNPNGKGYVKGGYIASFAGFIPANDPKYVIYIAVDSPKKSIYGSTVAGPVFSRVASYAVRKDGVAPLKATDINLADLRLRELAARQKEAIEKLKAAEVQITAGDLEKMSETQLVETVPNLMNLTTREVLRRMSGQDIKINFKGSGTVKKVIPEVGDKIPANKVISIILE